MVVREIQRVRERARISSERVVRPGEALSLCLFGSVLVKILCFRGRNGSGGRRKRRKNRRDGSSVLIEFSHGEATVTVQRRRYHRDGAEWSDKVRDGRNRDNETKNRERERGGGEGKGKDSSRCIAIVSPLSDRPRKRVKAKKRTG